MQLGESAIEGKPERTFGLQHEFSYPSAAQRPVRYRDETFVPRSVMRKVRCDCRSCRR